MILDRNIEKDCPPERRKQIDCTFDKIGEICEWISEELIDLKAGAKKKDIQYVKMCQEAIHSDLLMIEAFICTIKPLIDKEREA